MGGGRSEVSPGPVRGGERNIQVQTRPHSLAWMKRQMKSYYLTRTPSYQFSVVLAYRSCSLKPEWLKKKC
jgi:hypothetical protein